MALPVFSQNAISDTLSSQSGDFFDRLSNQIQNKQTISTEQLSRDDIIVSIAGNIGPDQICLSLGDFKFNSNWSIQSDGASIVYTGQNEQELDFFVLCETGGKLRETVQFFPLEEINENYIKHCPQLDSDNKELACVVVLTKSVPRSNGNFSYANLLFFIFTIVVLFPLLYLLRVKNINLKLFNLIKTVFLLAVFVVFYLFGTILTTLVTVMLLFFFFVQINLSIAPMILGLYSQETHRLKFVVKIVLVAEVLGLIASLIFITPYL
ncbi:MAG: hypothetical protein IIC74_02345 [Bacteroidetes bacterium]|nr:hypothetical protein [Bacteroidota bacterium]